VGGKGKDKGFNTKFEKANPESYTDKQRKEFPSHSIVVGTTSAKSGNNSKDEHTDWKSAHKGILQEVVDKRKQENRSTCCKLDEHTWQKY